jgi:uroporphyrinogen decarboxylase
MRITGFPLYSRYLGLSGWRQRVPAPPPFPGPRPSPAGVLQAENRIEIPVKIMTRNLMKNMLGLPKLKKQVLFMITLDLNFINTLQEFDIFTGMELDFKPFEPDFEMLLSVLRRGKTSRPVLFEFIINPELCRRAAPGYGDPEPGSTDHFRMVIDAFRALGYDYAPVYTWESDLMSFEKGNQEALASRSQNQGALITDRASFEKYPWPDPHAYNYELYETLGTYLPGGMKLLGCSNGGILENATDLVGFENLCMMYLTDPELTHEIFDHIGTRLVDFYSIVASFDSVGVCVVNDDWGFKTQTMFPPEMMESYIFPYTRRIVEVIHANGKPAILHSCGNLGQVMDVIIDDLKLDGKHSFEDGIYTVEDAYEWWGDRIAIMGGIDMDFLARRPPGEVYDRSVRLLERTFDRGGYALGSGNSIPDFIPVENYLSMLRAAHDFTGR